LTKTIAVAGKGGTGKTTVAAMIIRYLLERKLGNVLAIDADPSSNLNLALGLPLEDTVGDIREEALTKIKGGTFTPGMSKQDYLDYEVQNALVESEGVDLLAMGRPEGPHCYCAANNILRLCIDNIGNAYDFVVIDNEAGLEHLSRQTARHIDLLVIVADPTVKGLTAAGRVSDLVDELRTEVGRMVLIVNKVEAGHCAQGDGKTDHCRLKRELADVIVKYKLELKVTIPEDPLVPEFDSVGKPLMELPAGSVMYEAVTRFMDEMTPLLS
jgi:CO dehydrogenase maturation factor